MLSANCFRRQNASEKQRKKCMFHVSNKMKWKKVQQMSNFHFDLPKPTKNKWNPTKNWTTLSIILIINWLSAYVQPYKCWCCCCAQILFTLASTSSRVTALEEKSGESPQVNLHKYRRKTLTAIETFEWKYCHKHVQHGKYTVKNRPPHTCKTYPPLHTHEQIYVLLVPE